VTQEASREYEVGTVAASEALLTDLYISLRSALRRWSLVTKQTPQARMGYVGQHLASVVTGFPGGRSGARGKDLILPDGGYSEIKTCYRVDQLGRCLQCAAGVASIEETCPLCGSTNIRRNDDSKWLIGIRNEEEMRGLFTPQRYYLVLFDFADFVSATDINARIYEVNPRDKGFAYCMVDYYVNIAPTSTAPFNLWPFQLKFEAMKPLLIYHAVIQSDDTIETLVFPHQRGAPQLVPPRALTEYARSQNMTTEGIQRMAGILNAPLPPQGTKHRLLEALEEHRHSQFWSDEAVADALAEALYAERLREHRHWLPAELQ